MKRGSVKMSINFNFAKKLAAEQILKQAINYVDKDPEKNFIKVLNLVDKLPITEKHHNAINNIRENYEKSPVIREYVKKFTKIAPSYKTGLVMNFFINSALLGIPYQQKMAEEFGVSVPWTILFDPTSACNLSCTGCWAGKYNKSDTMEFETIDRLINEAKELGIYFFVLSGGEPTVYPHLFDIFEKHQDAGFMMYTNGTLIDDEMAEKMVKVGNVSPVISLEGYEEATDNRRGKGVYKKVMAAMDRLHKNGVVFGASLTATRDNAEELFATDDFIDMLMEKGVTYVWSFHYIPIGRKPDLDLMVSPEQRAMLARRVPDIRNRKPIFLADFWNDGTYTNGCIAGGKNYFHINAKGEVEPCAFVHFAVDNIKDKSLKEVLQNPLFKAYQKRQPFNENLLKPCPIIDNPYALREMVEESGAFPTHPGAETVLKGDIADYLDKISDKWGDISKPIFEERMGIKSDKNEKAQ